MAGHYPHNFTVHQGGYVFVTTLGGGNEQQKAAIRSLLAHGWEHTALRFRYTDRGRATLHVWMKRVEPGVQKIPDPFVMLSGGTVLAPSLVASAGNGDG